MKIILLLIACLLYKPVQAKEHVVADILREAEDYINVKPSHSYALLSQSLDLTPLNDVQRIRWYIAKVRSSVAINQLQNIEQDITQLLSYKQHDYFQEHIIETLNAMSIYLRRQGYWTQAKYSYECALKSNPSRDQKIGLLINLAVLARYLEDDFLSKKAYQQALEIAIKTKDIRAVATINNNLGSLALDKGNIDEAERHYRLALAGYQSTDIRTGNITAGTNLLLIFVIQKNTLNFQRLIEPISSFIDNFPDQSRKALLFWVVSADKVNQGQAIDEKTKTELKTAFYQLQGSKLQEVVNIYLAPMFKIELTIPSEINKKDLPTKPWFEQLNQCFK